MGHPAPVFCNNPCDLGIAFVLRAEFRETGQVQNYSPSTQSVFGTKYLRFVTSLIVARPDVVEIDDFNFVTDRYRVSYYIGGSTTYRDKNLI